LKRSKPVQAAVDLETQETVLKLLQDIERGGEPVVRMLNKRFDHWQGDVLVSSESIDRAVKKLPQSVKHDLKFAHQRVSNFACQQRDSMREFESELSDGLIVGQKLIPVSTAGCYVPGGRYAHAASAIMSIATAKAAGVENIIAATPARGSSGIHPAILYAMQLSGATAVLAAGGVQGVASLAYGLFTGQKADVIVGPGNRFVAEAKRVLFGKVGIDVIAGPTESLVIADDSADPRIIAADLAGQAEHGVDSPVWLVSTSEKVAASVREEMPRTIAALPEPARSVAANAWRDFGEIVVVEDREEAAQVSDDYAPEHLHVQAEDLEWWLGKLKNYGSLFLGEETTVTFGDKCSGPNHILPTRGAARYSGGLSVSKFIKLVSYQRMNRDAVNQVAPVAARISRLEGMEGHARSGDVRLQKYFPQRDYDLGGDVVHWTDDE
jgi:sulfopropanediol 3-dehydrogenase